MNGKGQKVVPMEIEASSKSLDSLNNSHLLRHRTFRKLVRKERKCLPESTWTMKYEENQTSAGSQAREDGFTHSVDEWTVG